MLRRLLAPLAALALLGACATGTPVDPADTSRSLVFGYIDADEAPDYVHLAPIFAPLSKPAERASLGVAGIAAAVGRGVPVLAQGGITAENAGRVRAAGAAGVAVTGAIGMAARPAEAAQALRRALDA